MNYKFKKFADERINIKIQTKGEQIEKLLKTLPLLDDMKNLFLKSAYNWTRQNELLARLSELETVIKEKNLSNDFIKDELKRGLQKKRYNDLH